MHYCHHNTLHYHILINPIGGVNINRRNTAVVYLEFTQISEYHVVTC